MNKVAIYVRVSTGKQELENQIFKLKDYIAFRDWELYTIYPDVISGKEESRPAFDKLFLDAHKRLFNIVLFWDLSRFSRAGLYHTIMKLKELENLKIKWISYNEPYLNTMDEFSKNIILAVMSSLAKIEREKISDRTKAGLERAKKQGKKLGRGKSITEKDKQKIIAKYKEYGSINKVANNSKYSYGTCYIVIKNYQKREGMKIV